MNASNHEEVFVVFFIINSFFICDIYIYIYGEERERGQREGGERERKEREGGVCGGQRSAIVRI